MSKSTLIGIVVGIGVELLISALIPGSSIIEIILSLVGGIACGILSMRKYRILKVV